MTIVYLDILIFMTMIYITTLNIFKKKKQNCVLLRKVLVKQSFIKKKSSFFFQNRIGGVMVSVLASECDRSWFRPPIGSNQRFYEIGICCFSAKHAALREKSKTVWLGIRLMCPSGTTCLSADCCFNGLALYKSN